MSNDSPEARLHLAHPDCESIDAALAWVVAQLDRHPFDFPKVVIQAVSVMEANDPATAWHRRWEASVSGQVPFPADPTSGVVP